jgi:hypothetical protein
LREIAKKISEKALTSVRPIEKSAAGVERHRSEPKRDERE